jgi:hypothetical protein
VRQRRQHDNPEVTPDLRSHLRSTQGYPEVVRSYVRRRSAKLLFEMKPSFVTPEYAAIALTRRSGGNRPRPRLRRLGIAQLWAGGRIGDTATHNKCTRPDRWLQVFSANAEVDSPRALVLRPGRDGRLFRHFLRLIFRLDGLGMLGCTRACHLAPRVRAAEGVNEVSLGPDRPG